MSLLRSYTEETREPKHAPFLKNSLILEEETLSAFIVARRGSRIVLLRSIGMG